jgi:hypothetical protein
MRLLVSGLIRGKSTALLFEFSILFRIDRNLRATAILNPDIVGIFVAEKIPFKRPIRLFEAELVLPGRDVDAEASIFVCRSFVLPSATRHQHANPFKTIDSALDETALGTSLSLLDYFDFS